MGSTNLGLPVATIVACTIVEDTGFRQTGWDGWQGRIVKTPGRAAKTSRAATRGERGGCTNPRRLRTNPHAPGVHDTGESLVPLFGTAPCGVVGSCSLRAVSCGPATRLPWPGHFGYGQSPRSRLTSSERLVSNLRKASFSQVTSSADQAAWPLTSDPRIQLRHGAVKTHHALRNPLAYKEMWKSRWKLWIARAHAPPQLAGAARVAVL